MALKRCIRVSLGYSHSGNIDGRVDLSEGGGQEGAGSHKGRKEERLHIGNLLGGKEVNDWTDERS